MKTNLGMGSNKNIESTSPENIIIEMSKDETNAGNVLIKYIKDSGERGFETISRNNTVLFLLKNLDQRKSVIELLKKANVNYLEDSKVMLSITVDYGNLFSETKRKYSKNYSSFE